MQTPHRKHQRRTRRVARRGDDGDEGGQHASSDPSVHAGLPSVGGAQGDEWERDGEGCVAQSHAARLRLSTTSRRSSRGVPHVVSCADILILAARDFVGVIVNTQIIVLASCMTMAIID